MRAMVTGGAGFIGSNLVDRLLAEGQRSTSWTTCRRARSPISPTARGAGGPLRFHNLDVRSGDFVDLVRHRRPEVIFHLAAQADVRVSVERPVFDAEVNILGTIQVLEGARAAGTERSSSRPRGARFTASRAGAICRSRASAAPAAVALRRLEEVGHRLHGRLPGAVRHRVHRPCPRQRLRPAPGPARRSRRGGDLRGQPARAGASASIFGDGSQTRDYVYVDESWTPSPGRHVAAAASC